MKPKHKSYKSVYQYIYNKRSIYHKVSQIKTCILIPNGPMKGSEHGPGGKVICKLAKLVNDF